MAKFKYKGVTRKGIDLCLRCAPVQGGDRQLGKSQIENTHVDAGFVRRIRACTNCGQTWTTAEISLTQLRKLLKLEQQLKDIFDEANHSP